MKRGDEVAEKEGWIKLHRKIQDCYLWSDKPYDKARAWIDLLLCAMHHDKKLLIDGNVVVISRGSFLTTRGKLAEKWGWSLKKVDKYLKLLENEKMVTTKRTPKGTTLTIVNYEEYQIVGTTEDTPKDITEGTTEDTTEDTQNKNIKNYKNEKNNINTICSEPNMASEPSVISLTLNDKSEYPIYQKDIDEWKELYPSVDVIQQLRNMKGWCNSNPTKRKTRRGIKKFINSWLSKEQDKPKRYDNSFTGNFNNDIDNKKQERQ